MVRVQEPTYPGPTHHVSCETRLSPPCLSLMAGPDPPVGHTCSVAGAWEVGAGTQLKELSVGEEDLAEAGFSLGVAIATQASHIDMGMVSVPALVYTEATGHLRAGADAGEAYSLVRAPLLCLGPQSLSRSKIRSAQGVGGPWPGLLVGPAASMGTVPCPGPVATIAFGSWEGQRFESRLSPLPPYFGLSVSSSCDISQEQRGGPAAWGAACTVSSSVRMWSQ